MNIAIQALQAQLGMAKLDLLPTLSAFGSAGGKTATRLLLGRSNSIPLSAAVAPGADY